MLGLAVAGEREVVEGADADGGKRFRVRADDFVARQETAGALKLSCGLLVQIATSEEGLGSETGFSMSRSNTEKSVVSAERRKSERQAC